MKTMKENLTDCISRIMQAIDNHPRLTRKGYAPELHFSLHGWVAVCHIRSKEGKGTGSRSMTRATSDLSDTPEEAVDNLIASLEIWDKTLSS